MSELCKRMIKLMSEWPSTPRFNFIRFQPYVRCEPVDVTIRSQPSSQSPVSSQVFSGVFYISTYEGVRHLLATKLDVHDLVVRAFVGGLCASVVGQMITVPFDVVSQHMMLIGAGSQDKGVKKLRIAR